MTVSYKELLTKKEVRPYLLDARFGIEKEGHRVDMQGRLSKSSHPTVFGSRSFHPYIQTDFCESQTEAITPVFDHSSEPLNFMSALSDVITRSLEHEEMIWPLSMPPALPENEAEIQLADLEAEKDVRYRQGLADRYGKRKQMVSGIHYNFEFANSLLQSMFEQTNEADYKQFKTDVYMKLSRQYLRYMWILNYALGASPRADKCYFTEKDYPTEAVRSIRNSRFGYRNELDVFVSYENLDKYYADLSALVSAGKLSEMKEFYSSARLRGGERAEDLIESGVRYVEFRNFDLNPFVREGMDVDTARFVHLFALYLFYREEDEGNRDDNQRRGHLANDTVTLEHPFEKTAYYDEGKAFFSEMRAFAQSVELSRQDIEIIERFEQLLDHPELTLAGQMETRLVENSEFAVDLARQYRGQAFERPFQLSGFTDMELSTQNLIFDAIQKGLELEILDEEDQMIALRYKNHEEIIQKGNMTSKDSMIAYSIMENKVVTKKLLNRAGLNTPSGREFSSFKEASKAYSIFEDQAIVVKPKSTNYGLGISIFHTPAKQEQYDQALEIAFKEDRQILVEEFVSGTEYRFFVLDGKTIAVLRRDPCNVIGDGQSTIAQLVEVKNQSSLRGLDHRYPLEKIQLGNTEKLMLEVQGYTIESILGKNVKVNLRENSNISTGGDSIDMTDAMPQSYKCIAEQAAEALDVKITGIDILIPELVEDGEYSIIEANFNPAMLFHLYPLTGQGQRVTMEVIKFLFPEVIE